MLPTSTSLQSPPRVRSANPSNTKNCRQTNALSASTLKRGSLRLTNYCGRLPLRQADMPTSRRTQKNSATPMLKLPNLSVTSICSNSIRPRTTDNCTLLQLERDPPGTTSITGKLMLHLLRRHQTPQNEYSC